MKILGLNWRRNFLTDSLFDSFSHLFVCFMSFVASSWPKGIFYYTTPILFVTHAYMSCHYIIWPKKSINAKYVIYCSFTFLYVLNSTCKSALSSRTFKWYGVVFNGTQLNTVTKYLYCSFYWYLMFRFDNPLNYSQCTMTFTFDFHFFLIKCCHD